MNDREFEEFILMQVKRSHSIHAVCRWLYLVMAIAGVVVFFIGMSMHLSLSGGVSVLILSAGFLPASILSRSAASAYAEAAEEIEYGLAHPECNVPEDYMDSTKNIRRDACRTLKSTKSLVASYGSIALMCWAGGIIIVIVSEPGSPWFEPALFALSFVMFTMAVILTVLTVKSIRDLPMAGRYAQWLKENADTDKDGDFGSSGNGCENGDGCGD